MKDIKAEHDHHLYGEVQVRFSRIMEMLYWCPGGSQPEPESGPRPPAPRPAGRPNLTKPGFIVSFFGKSYFCPDVRIQPLWTVEDPGGNEVFFFYSRGFWVTGGGSGNERIIIKPDMYYPTETGGGWIDLNVYNADGSFRKSLQSQSWAFTSDDTAVWPRYVRIAGDKLYLCLNCPWASLGFYITNWYADAIEIDAVSPDTGVALGTAFGWKIAPDPFGRVFCSHWDDCELQNNNRFISLIEYLEPVQPYDHFPVMAYEAGGDLAAWPMGFCFDVDGNLWVAERLSDVCLTQYYPCRVGMWTKAQVDYALGHQEPALDWGNAAKTIDIPVYPGTADNLAGHDIEYHADGHVYVSTSAQPPSDHFVRSELGPGVVFRLTEADTLDEVCRSLPVDGVGDRSGLTWLCPVSETCLYVEKDFVEGSPPEDSNWLHRVCEREPIDP